MKHTNLDEKLRQAFAAPKPKHKEQFLRTLGYPKIGYGGFLFSQLQYLHLRVWLLSAFVVLASALLSFWPQVWWFWAAKSSCWIIASLLPFLALAVSIELTRSSCCRMAELEMSCRFSLHQVIMARLMLLGCGNFAVLLAVLLLMHHMTPIGFAYLTLYLLTPYLLTSSLCLLLLNHTRGKDGLYGCAGIACAVSTMNGITGIVMQMNYGAWLHRCVTMIFVASILILVVQIYKLIKQTEEIQWNLFLTE